MKSQSAAIAAVIGTGVAMFTMYLSTFDSLARSQASYYDTGRFADVFAACKRAPNWLVERIEEIPDVAEVEDRVVVDVTLDVPEVAEPVRGRLLSIPEVDRATLNDVVVRRGRYIATEADDEVLIHEAFADELRLEPGDRIAAVVNGRRRELTIAGVGLSPEYIYVIGPGDVVPDHRRFGILWMGRRALAAAFDMEGGFNHVSLRLAGDTARGGTAVVVAELDRLLKRYGGLGAIERRHQQSHWFIENEMRELRTMASILPAIFLGVAAFLLNIVLSRAVAVQRTQIAALKAVGYDNPTIATHYLAIGLLVAGLGTLAGCLAGMRLGEGLTGIYAHYFRLPDYTYEVAPRILLAASAISFVASSLGSLGAVRRALALPPAEAMRPEPPARFRPTWLEALGLGSVLGASGRMMLRNIARRPWRFALSSLGVAMSIALLVLGAFFIDAIDHLISVQFDSAQRQDMTVTFVEPRSWRSRHALARFPGVTRVEPFRSVPVELRHDHRTRRVAILGLAEHPELNRVIDRKRGPVVLPEEGLVLSSALASLLGAGRGSTITVEVIEGARPIKRVVVSDVVDDFLGLSAYMRSDALASLMREDSSFSGAFLSVDPSLEGPLFSALKHTPDVAGVSMNRAAILSFRDTIRANMMRIIVFNVLFSSVIAIGVVYNAARISLSERSRDLASLRVLGFSSMEISVILLGELAAVTLVAIPIGIVCGRGLSWLTLALLDNELYRIPLIIEPSTYAASVLVILVASLLSGILVQRRLRRLDLVGALKVSE